MPKELIASTPGSNVVEVTWGTGPYSVQIATYSHDRLISHTVPKNVVDAGVNPVDIETTPEHTPFTGWYADLGRDEINRLIRVLRRARDKSFGSDA